MIEISSKRIYLTEFITYEKVTEAIEEIKKLLGKPGETIKVVFSSRGGDADAALFFYGEIMALSQENRERLVAIASGEVRSAALTSFLAFDKRWATKFAGFLIHGTEAHYNEIRFSQGSLKKEYADIVDQNKRLRDIICERTEISKEEAKKALETNKYLRFKPEGALEAGIIHKIFLTKV